MEGIAGGRRTNLGGANRGQDPPTELRVSRLLLVELEKRRNALKHHGENCRRKFARFMRIPVPPIEALQMVREDYSIHSMTRRECYFKRVALGMTCYGAQNRKAHLLIIFPRRKNYGRSPSRLFPPGVRREIYPNKVASLRHIIPGYHNSFPTGSPQSVSEC